MKTTSRSRSFYITALALLSLTAISTHAATTSYYWGQTSLTSGTYAGTMATGSNWFYDAAATSGAAEAPNSLDHAIFFNTTPANAVGGAVVVNSSLSAESLTFNTSGTTVLAQSGNQNLILGSGGITLGASSGPVNVGVSTNTLSVRLSTAQTWTNNSANTLTVRALTTNTEGSAKTLTLNAASSGGILFSLNINDTVADPLGIVIDSGSSGLVTINGAANGYRGGTTIKRGALSTFGTLGSGAVLLGDTTGSSNATLNVRSSGTFTNHITVRAGSSGTKTLTTNQTGGVTLSGSLTLDANLAVTNSTDGTFHGVISGTGGIVKGGNNALTFTGTNTFTGNLTISTGAFTLAEAGSLTFSIGTNGVNNQINGASAGAVALNGTFNFDLSGASLVHGNSWNIVTVSNENYGDSFAITGFTQNANVWTNLTGFTFTESTGVLSYAIPEPSTFTLLMGSVLGIFVFGKRRQQRAQAGL